MPVTTEKIMSRALRIEYPNALYHITSRGNDRKLIFLANDDYMMFLRLLKQTLQRYNWLCYAYCLMPNHYHLLIETPDANVSAGMRYLNSVYTQKFNQSNDRVGHIFQGRFKAILVEKENYLTTLLRYIAFNPVRAKLANTPQDWRWSSYHETIAATNPIVARDILLAYFGQTNNESLTAYREFIAAGAPADIWRNVKKGMFLGQNKWIEEIKPPADDITKIIEIPRAQRYFQRPPLNELFNPPISRQERNNKIYMAQQKYGYSLAEISKHLNLNYSWISRIAEKVRRKEEETTKSKT